MIPKKEKRIIFHMLLHYIKCLRDPFWGFYRSEIDTVPSHATCRDETPQKKRDSFQKKKKKLCGHSPQTPITQVASQTVADVFFVGRIFLGRLLRHHT